MLNQPEYVFLKSLDFKLVLNDSNDISKLSIKDQISRF